MFAILTVKQKNSKYVFKISIFRHSEVLSEYVLQQDPDITTIPEDQWYRGILEDCEPWIEYSVMISDTVSAEAENCHCQLLITRCMALNEDNGHTQDMFLFTVLNKSIFHLYAMKLIVQRRILVFLLLSFVYPNNILFSMKCLKSYF